jgi:hypothetical protein
VYADPNGGWYYKARVGRDPLTGRWQQVTRRGFRTAVEAGRARRELLGQADVRVVHPSTKLLSVDDLLDLYLEGLDVDRRVSRKTQADYRNYARFYVRPLLGSWKAGD